VVAESVSVLVPEPGAAMVAGAKLALMPVGSPLTEKLTAELKVALAAVVKVTLLCPPRVTVTAALAPRLKLGAISTVTVLLAVLMTPPPVAVIVIKYALGTTLVAALSVSVLVPEPGAAIPPGEKLAVMPLGSPLTARLMALLKVLFALVVSVRLPLFPAANVSEPELTLKLKLGAARTVTVQPAVLVTPPPVAVMVSA